MSAAVPAEDIHINLFFLNCSRVRQKPNRKIWPITVVIRIKKLFFKAIDN